MFCGHEHLSRGWIKSLTSYHTTYKYSKCENDNICTTTHSITVNSHPSFINAADKRLCFLTCMFNACLTNTVLTCCELHHAQLGGEAQKGGCQQQSRAQCNICFMCAQIRSKVQTKTMWCLFLCFEELTDHNVDDKCASLTLTYSCQAEQAGLNICLHKWLVQKWLPSNADLSRFALTWQRLCGLWALLQPQHMSGTDCRTMCCCRSNNYIPCLLYLTFSNTTSTIFSNCSAL